MKNNSVDIVSIREKRLVQLSYHLWECEIMLVINFYYIIEEECKYSYYYISVYI